MKHLTVWMGEQLAGTWGISKDNTHSFQYDESYLANDNATPLSRSMPLQSTVFEGSFIHDFFANLLPESEQIQKNIKARFQLPRLMPLIFLLRLAVIPLGH